VKKEGRKEGRLLNRVKDIYISAAADRERERGREKKI
jgi:hypothetical protein